MISTQEKITFTLITGNWTTVGDAGAGRNRQERCRHALKYLFSPACVLLFPSGHNGAEIPPVLRRRHRRPKDTFCSNTLSLVTPTEVPADTEASANRSGPRLFSGGRLPRSFPLVADSWRAMLHLGSLKQESVTQKCCLEDRGRSAFHTCGRGSVCVCWSSARTAQCFTMKYFRLIFLNARHSFGEQM